MSQHKRIDYIRARRARALEALKNDRFIIQNTVATYEDDLRAFARNERSLDRAPVSIQRDVEDMKRQLDRIDMEIAVLSLAEGR